jgi:hypothetical protein
VNSTYLPQISNKFAGIKYWVQTGKESRYSFEGTIVEYGRIEQKLIVVHSI